MKTKHLSFVNNGGDYQSVVLWRRNGEAPMFEQLMKHEELREDLIAAIPHIDADIDEVVAKIPAKYFADDPVDIRKSIEPNKETKMNLNEPESAPVSISEQAAGNLAMVALHGIAENIRRAHPSLTREQAFLRAYSDPSNAVLTNAERNAHMDAIGAAVGYATPVNKSATDGTDIYKRAKEIQTRDSIDFDRAWTKAALPTMMNLRPRDLGTYETGASITPGLDSDFPITAEVERLADEMRRAARDGKNFDRAAAAYLRAQQRVEAAAREAGAVR